MILSHGVGFEEAYLAFRPLHQLVDGSEPAGVSIRSCWWAMCCAKVHGWVDFDPVLRQGPQSPGSVHVEEYLHYARCLKLLGAALLLRCVAPTLSSLSE